jgi:hypothetical protein
MPTVTQKKIVIEYTKTVKLTAVNIEIRFLHALSMNQYGPYGVAILPQHLQQFMSNFETGLTCTVHISNCSFHNYILLIICCQRVKAH